MKVLLAEDNPINMAVVKRLLTKWGIEIVPADKRQRSRRKI